MGSTLKNTSRSQSESVRAQWLAREPMSHIEVTSGSRTNSRMADRTNSGSSLITFAHIAEGQAVGENLRGAWVNSSLAPLIRCSVVGWGWGGISIVQISPYNRYSKRDADKQLKPCKGGYQFIFCHKFTSIYQ